MAYMDKNDIAVYFLQNAKKIEKRTGYAYARNGIKLRALFPEREIKQTMTSKYGVQM